VEALLEALVPADAETAELPRYEANRPPGSTRDVDFWTSRPVRKAQRSPLNYLVMDTQQWEQSAAFYLDGDPHVRAFVRNVNLGFAIPYAYRGETREYVPDFLARLQEDDREVGMLVLETKGYDPATAAKVEGAHRWCDAVNAEGSHGRWVYRIVTSPTDVPRAVRSAVNELADPPGDDWRGALAAFVRELRALYGDRLQQVVLYGSRARGTAERGSDIDTLVVLDSVADFWREKERINPLAARASLDHDVVVSAMPVSARELAEPSTALLQTIRREGVRVG
jgi:predicted nucleotidyltransferase